VATWKMNSVAGESKAPSMASFDKSRQSVSVEFPLLQDGQKRKLRFSPKPVYIDPQSWHNAGSNNTLASPQQRLKRAASVQPELFHLFALGVENQGSNLYLSPFDMNSAPSSKAKHKTRTRADCVTKST
jgi:hypothetical protein